MPMPKVMVSSASAARNSKSPGSGGRPRFLDYTLANSSRKKPRRWPLVLRFTKGSVHRSIWFPVGFHSAFTALIVYINQNISRDVSLPSSIIPSLSIVVGLMLVFRNQTAYQRFWSGRLHLNTITTSIRNLSRQILVGVPSSDSPNLDPSDKQRIIETTKILIACLYTIKNHLRTEWGVMVSPGTVLVEEEGQVTASNEYKDLLPDGLRGYEDRGLGLTLEMAVFLEKFVNQGTERGWFHNASSSTMLSQLNSLIHAYGEMEVIRLVPVPVAHLIHHQQTLAIFCIFLPFAMAAEMGWWAIPLVTFVSFTLYGIEGIAQTFEDPFGREKIDINLDDVVEDTRKEVEVLMSIWLRGGEMFAPTSRSNRQSHGNLVGLGLSGDATSGNMSGGGGSGGGERDSSTAVAGGRSGRPVFTREYTEFSVDGGRGGSIVEGVHIRHVESGGSANVSGTPIGSLGAEQRRRLLSGSGEEYGTMGSRET